MTKILERDFGENSRKSSIARFFPVWLGFFGLVWFFSGLGLVRFFWFQAYKIETESVNFLKILNGLIDCFHISAFSIIFFPVFSV
jgi:hypothetical protein